MALQLCVFNFLLFYKLKENKEVGCQPCGASLWALLSGGLYTPHLPRGRAGAGGGRPLSHGESSL